MGVSDDRCERARVSNAQCRSPPRYVLATSSAHALGSRSKLATGAASWLRRGRVRLRSRPLVLASMQTAAVALSMQSTMGATDVRSVRSYRTLVALADRLAFARMRIGPRTHVTSSEPKIRIIAKQRVQRDRRQIPVRTATSSACALFFVLSCHGARPSYESGGLVRH